ncbi:MAG: cysteine--tRNA ligase [Rickettsiales bacterium]|jgi:cysteinyl-tRNA synthetase|nr:cysteine--tRNA ligase [Rickettsiales bacterium]
MLKLYNSLSEKKENFIPVNGGEIGLYSCGITVYDILHIGHARTVIFVDILVKMLRRMYKNVIYVRNITDIDDKIIARATERKITIKELTKEIIESCNEDFAYLNLAKPNFEPKATEHVGEIIKIIQRLIDNGFAYISEGNVLFSIEKYKDYGKLSHKNPNDLMAGARVEVECYKQNPMDFVLWKPSLETDDEYSKFESPWGLGRPGWHIECSAMSNKYLGEDFDIHCGGIDLKFPHHENEIAQSCCAFSGSKYANFWFHVGALMVEGQKMSKSLKNFVTIKEIKKRNIKGSVLRFMMLKNHYRKPFDFREEILLEAEKSLRNLHDGLNEILHVKEIPDELEDVLCDDLNTPNAVALLNKFKKEKRLIDLKNSMIFLGIYDEKFFEKEILITEAEIKDLLEKRKIAKLNKDWAESDRIREYLKGKKVLLEDNQNGTIWKYI